MLSVNRSQGIKKVTTSEFEQMRPKLENGIYGQPGWRREMGLHRTNDGKLRQVFCTGHGDFALLAAFMKESISLKGESEPPKSYTQGAWDMSIVLRKKMDPRLKLVVDAFGRKNHEIGHLYSPDIPVTYHAVMKVDENQPAEELIANIEREAHAIDRAIGRVLRNGTIKAGSDCKEIIDAIAAAVDSLPDDNVIKARLQEDAKGMMRSYRMIYENALGIMIRDRELNEAMEKIADKH